MRKWMKVHTGLRKESGEHRLARRGLSGFSGSSSYLPASFICLCNTKEWFSSCIPLRLTLLPV
ncbi:hypothetical protein E2C01_087996 [Portunus trituberculatus]|uniref:Uncharacterized protein n=1 Tax=Portunus trituberculatus TaxID=210409 RepID=A0A5B7JET3_PORTR|nr:hypothetical protein [Portunus trituberculatus]